MGLPAGFRACGKKDRHFGRGIGTLTVHDATQAAWNGRGVNWPQRAMKGYHWASSKDWRQQPGEFSAMYFSRG